MRVVVLVCLAVAVWLVFWPVLGHDFISYDDESYVTHNLQVKRGVTLAGLGWALTAFHAANWHPLTWLSHMLDWQLYGGNAAGHHLTNLLLHTINTLLLFVVLHRATGATYRSAAVALLFGIHPLHVESVAWVAERKDVLSTLFWLLTTLAYLRYVRSPGPTRHVLVAAGLALGLCAKAMLVTLPLTLLLLDYWPLGRLDVSGHGAVRRVSRLFVEKIPLLALSAVASVVTVAAQRSGGAVVALAEVGLADRLANAATAYWTYLARTVWPSGLAIPYPLRPDRPAWIAIVAGIALVATSLGALRVLRSRPYIAFGWFWYLGTLVPVIGLVQVGMESGADRFTYVPLIGIFVIVAWGVPDLVRRGQPRPADLPITRADLLWVAALLTVAVPLMIVAHRQVRHWRDSLHLFAHSIAVTTDNFVAHNAFGLALLGAGRTAESLEQFRRALAVHPELPETHNYMGGAHAALGQAERAVASYERAIRLRPDFPEAWNNLGVALAGAGRVDEAIEKYREAIRLRPAHAEAHANLAHAYYSKGRFDLAKHEMSLARSHGLPP